MNIIKQNKAITLIALIITIIVLLILAGVTINMVLGENGLFSKAKTSVGKYENEQAKESSLFEKLSNDIDIESLIGNRDNSALKEEIINELKEYIDTKFNFSSPTQVYNCKAEYKSDYIAAGRIDLRNTTVFSNQSSPDNYTTVSERDSGGYIKINKSGFYTINLNGSTSGVLSFSGYIEFFDTNKQYINTISNFVDYTHNSSFYNNTVGSLTVYLEKDQYIRPAWTIEAQTATKSFYAGITIYKNFV